MANPAAKSRAAVKKSPIVEVAAEDGDHVEPPPPEVVEPDPELSPEEAEEARKDYLLTRFWISARGFWGKNGDRLAWILTLGLLVLIVANVGFQYGINVWNRSIFDAIEKRDSVTVFHLTALFFPLAISSVALGVVVTAVGQSVLGGLGLALAGVPLAAVLTAVMFMLCIAQLGPLPVLVPAVIWLYWSGESVWGTVLLTWSVLLSTLDSVVRPLLIRRGAHLPLLLLLAGVIGGLIAFGLVGIFLGPVVLAVAYTLLLSWMSECEASEDQIAAGRR